MQQQQETAATDSLAAHVSRYRNTAEHNDRLHADFTRLTDTVPSLKAHRDWVEKRQWGFGDRAVHYLWRLARPALAERIIMPRFCGLLIPSRARRRSGPVPR